ncbi:hypothetical protein GCM10023188_25700 [Pontibacter saemangeumensis]|uniref:Uncharacterized protein n=1 Tax=Pontibacter saemangeumensis TaxID=1084525 RepID=A0ABP8LU00_9BACT
MDQVAQLVARAQALLDNPTATIQQLNAVYYICIGRNCTTERKIRYMLNSFVNNPNSYRLRIESYFSEKKMENEKRNYRFTRAAAGSVIMLHDKNGRPVKVTAETLTDERAELVLSNPRLAHNIERIPGTEIKPKPSEEEKAEQAAAEEAAKLEALAAAEKAAAEKAAAEAAEAERLAAEQAAAEEAAKLENAQKRYTELLGHKPGNRSLETLLAAIAEAEAEDKE